MKKRTAAWIAAALLGFCGASIGLFSGTKGEPRQTARPAAASAAGLPASLDAFFPPRAKEPVFLFRMLGLSSPLSGIMTDLQEKEPANALANFEKFKAQYGEVSKMVPEWTTKFPAGPVAGLGQALKSGNQETLTKAVGQVYAVCMGCHLETMVKVQHKYHWGDFAAIKTTDPLTKAQIDGSTLMLYLDGSLNGVTIDLGEGQKENARAQFQAFKLRFQTLKNVCGECHGTDPRKYYVSENVQGLITGLEQVLAAPSPDTAKAAALIQGIGMESCFKCHLVHIPAAYARMPGAGGTAK